MRSSLQTRWHGTSLLLQYFFIFFSVIGLGHLLGFSPLAFATLESRDVPTLEQEGTEEQGLPWDWMNDELTQKDPGAEFGFRSSSFKAVLTPEDRWLRTQSVLGAWGANDLENIENLPTTLEVDEPEDYRWQERLRVLDPRGGFSSFVIPQPILTTPLAVPSGLPQALSQSLMVAGSPYHFGQPVLRVVQRPRGAAGSFPESDVLPDQAQGWRGTRIALDPGHMGTPFWDGATGKRVRGPNGKILSEGQLAVQLAHLLRDAFVARGAEVMITHETLGPVATSNLAEFDALPHAREKLRQQILMPWFVEMISTPLRPGETFQSRALASPRIRELFSSSSSRRLDYYISYEDLRARESRIKAFRPDLVLVLHFDTASDGGLQSGNINETKAYVPGGYGEREFASADQRLQFVKRLFETRTQRASIALSTSIVNEISERLNIRRNSNTYGGGVSVGEGVVARNLFLTRVFHGPVAISYLESLVYDGREEFARLSETTGGVQVIGGVSLPYSRRLAALSDAIVQGVDRYLSERH
jgi:N-acetylmuramoyl-L-alanine amidase